MGVEEVVLPEVVPEVLLEFWEDEDVDVLPVLVEVLELLEVLEVLDMLFSASLDLSDSVFCDWVV